MNERGARLAQRLRLRPGRGAPDNDSLTYAWSAPAGITLTGANTATPDLHRARRGDGDELRRHAHRHRQLGATGTDVVRITVNAVNRAPTANAGADASADERTVVTLSGSGTDPDSGAPDNDAIASYAWTAPPRGSPSPARTPRPRASPLRTSPAPPPLDFTLTVTDGSGATGTDTVRITVNNVNRAPVANAGADAIAIERTVVPAQRLGQRSRQRGSGRRRDRRLPVDRRRRE